jgi:hypothetical protein
MNEKEKEKMQKKVTKSKLSQNEYLVRSATDKEIIVVDGLHDFTLELKRIGNNINQITRAVNEGKTNCEKELSEVKKELMDLWQLSKQLTRGQV